MTAARSSIRRTAEIARAIAELEKELPSRQGKAPVRQIRVYTSKGSELAPYCRSQSHLTATSPNNPADQVLAKVNRLNASEHSSRPSTS
jgi:hypothetical protein